MNVSIFANGRMHSGAKTDDRYYGLIYGNTGAWVARAITPTSETHAVFCSYAEAEAWVSVKTRNPETPRSPSEILRDMVEFFTNDTPVRPGSDLADEAVQCIAELS